MTETHYITIGGNREPVEPFIEAENLEISFDFENRTAEANTSQVTFFGKTAQLILDYKADPSNIFKALKYEIELVDANETLVISRYIDSKNILHEKEKNYVKCNFIREIDQTQIIELAKNVNFAGFDKYKDVPYVISEIPNNQEIALLSFAFFYIVFEYQKIVSDLIKAQGETASVVDAPSGILETISTISKLVILLVQGLSMINRVIRSIIQPIKYKRYAYVRDLFDYAANRIGLSGGADSIFHNNNKYRNAAIVCKSFINPEEQDGGLRGFFFPNTNNIDYLDKNFDFVMSDLTRFFNLKRIEVDESSNKLIIDVENTPTTAAFSIDDYSDVEISDNASELNASYYLAFSTDTNELNTVDQYVGTAVQSDSRFPTTLPINENLLTGSTQIQTYFTRTIEKTSLTFPEKLVKAFYTVLDAILNPIFEILELLAKLINGIARPLNRLISFLGLNFQIPEINIPPRENLRDRIEDRIGALLLQNDFLSNEKLGFVFDNNEPRKRRVKRMSAVDVFNDFHTRELLINNLKKRKEYRKVRLRLEDFNNIIRDEALILGQEVERVLSINWIKERNFATLRTESVVSTPITDLSNKIVIPGDRL